MKPPCPGAPPSRLRVWRSTPGRHGAAPRHCGVRSALPLRAKVRAPSPPLPSWERGAGGRGAPPSAPGVGARGRGVRGASPLSPRGRGGQGGEGRTAESLRVEVRAKDAKVPSGLITRSISDALDTGSPVSSRRRRRLRLPVGASHCGITALNSRRQSRQKAPLTSAGTTRRSVRRD